MSPLYSKEQMDPVHSLPSSQTATARSNDQTKKKQKSGQWMKIFETEIASIPSTWTCIRTQLLRLIKPTTSHLN